MKASPAGNYVYRHLWRDIECKWCISVCYSFYWRVQLIQVAMPRANTEPLRRCAQVTSGHCLHLQGKKFLRTLISKLGKYSFILCDSSSPLSCSVYYGPKAINPFMSSVPVYTSDRTTNHLPWFMPRGFFFCCCFDGMEERYCHDKVMNAGRA